MKSDNKTFQQQVESEVDRVNNLPNFDENDYKANSDYYRTTSMLENAILNCAPLSDSQRMNRARWIQDEHEQEIFD